MTRTAKASQIQRQGGRGLRPLEHRQRGSAPRDAAGERLHDGWCDAHVEGHVQREPVSVVTRSARDWRTQPSRGSAAFEMRRLRSERRLRCRCQHMHVHACAKGRRALCRARRDDAEAADDPIQVVARVDVACGLRARCVAHHAHVVALARSQRVLVTDGARARRKTRKLSRGRLARSGE